MDHVTEETQTDAIRKLEGERDAQAAKYRRLVLRSSLALATIIMGCIAMGVVTFTVASDRDAAIGRAGQLEKMLDLDHPSRGVLVFRADGSVKGAFPIRDGAHDDLMNAMHYAEYVVNQTEGDHAELTPATAKAASNPTPIVHVLPEAPSMGEFFTRDGVAYYRSGTGHTYRVRDLENTK